MIEDFVCPSCQKKHESEEPVCEFCGQDLKEAIITYKKKIEPLQFYKEIKKGQKKREKYGDMQLKDDMDRCNPLFWFYGTSTRQELYERKKKRMEKKQRRIPKK